MRSSVLAVAFACLLPVSAFAADRALDAEGDFHAQRAAISADLGAGERYAEMSRGDRNEVDAALSRIALSLDGQASITALSGAARTGADRDADRVNTLLAVAAADSRVVCRRVKALGSNRAQNSCLTVAERRRQQNGASNALQQGQGPGAPGP